MVAVGVPVMLVVVVVLVAVMAVVAENLVHESEIYATNAKQYRILEIALEQLRRAKQS